MKNFLKHPLVVFGLGIAAGYLVHRYRREILASATQFTDKGREFVLGSQDHGTDAPCEHCEE